MLTFGALLLESYRCSMSIVWDYHHQTWSTAIQLQSSKR